MDYQQYLDGTFDQSTGEFDVNKAKEKSYPKDILNILLMGATGVGKSSLINALFGDDVVKTGAGKPVTQHLEKKEMKEKGLVLWDTKGIEAKAYQETISSIENTIEQSLKTRDYQQAIDIAYLCIKESSSRVEDRDLALLSLAKKFGIPTIVVFTDTLQKHDEFVKEAKKVINQNFGDFIKDRYVRVNSVKYEIMRGVEIPQIGLDELYLMTRKLLEEANSNKAKQFARIQRVDNKERLKEMKDSANNIIHISSAAAGTAGASPIPGSDAPIIAAIQSTMIYKLNSTFELEMEQSLATSTITGILGVTALAQVGKTIVTTCLKFIPGVGSVAGGAIAAGTAIAITEAVGHAYVKVLENYYNIDTGDVELPANTADIMNYFKSVFSVSK